MSGGGSARGRACGVPLATSHVFSKIHCICCRRQSEPAQLLLLPTGQLLLLPAHQLLPLANFQLLSLPATRLLQSEKRLLKGAQERPKTYQMAPKLLPETPTGLLRCPRAPQEPPGVKNLSFSYVSATKIETCLSKGTGSALKCKIVVPSTFQVAPCC